MPRLRALRLLQLERSPQPGRPAHVSAASGLAAVGGSLYVIADDEHHLARFDAAGRGAGSLVRVLPGSLPVDKTPRKRRKPDFESLVALPSIARHPHGVLLALGSGSRPNRQRAVVVALTRNGKPARAAPIVVDVSPMYARLAPLFAEVNVEGAFVDGDRLSLLQRGNKGDERNARVDFALAPVLDTLSGGGRSIDASLIRVTPFALPKIADVPLCFTDGAALADGAFTFTAVAEDTDDSYADGRCAGSAIGIARADRIVALWRLRPSLKVEGIAVRTVAAGLELTVVTDADDASHPAKLLRTVIPRESRASPVA